MTDPGVLEQVLLIRADHGLLPLLTGERPDRRDVLPYRDVQEFSRGTVTGPAYVLSYQPRLLRHQWYGDVSQEQLECGLLAGVDRRPEHANDHGCLPLPQRCTTIL